MYNALAQVNLGSPVNWQHPLNQGRLAWFLCLPGMMGGARWPDLCAPADLTRSGVMTGFTVDLHARGSSGGWRNLSRPGGYGNLFISSSLAGGIGAAVPRNILFGLATFSVSGWMFLDSVSFNDNAIISSNDHAGTGSSFYMALDGNTSSKMIFAKEVSAVVASATSNAAPTINKWAHYLGTCNGNGLLTLYVNGVKQTLTQTASSAAIVETTSTTIGLTSSGSRTSYIDDVGLWNRCLNPVEAMQVYLQSTQGNPDTLNRVARRIKAAGGTAFTASLSGSLSMAGAMTRRPAKAFAGSLTSSGALTRAAAKAYAGSFTLAGSLAKQGQKPFTGATTASGALTRQGQKALTGAVTMSGALTRAISKAFVGTTTLAGVLTKKAIKSFAGSVTTSATFAGIKVILKSFSGAITVAGAMTKQTGKSLTGAIASAGAITKACSKAFGGTATLAGALTRKGIKAFAGALTMTGSMTRQCGKALVGAVAAGGVLTKRTAKGFTGACTMAGSLAKRAAKSFAGAITASGAFSKSFIGGGVSSAKAILLLLFRSGDYQ